MKCSISGDASKLRTHSTDQQVLNSIEDFFKTEIVPKLLKGSEDDLSHRLKTIIDNKQYICRQENRTF